MPSTDFSWNGVLPTSIVYLCGIVGLSVDNTQTKSMPTHMITPKLQISTSYECPPLATKISGAI